MACFIAFFGLCVIDVYFIEALMQEQVEPVLQALDHGRSWSSPNEQSTRHSAVLVGLPYFIQQVAHHSTSWLFTLAVASSIVFLILFAIQAISKAPINLVTATLCIGACIGQFIVVHLLA